MYSAKIQIKISALAISLKLVLSYALKARAGNQLISSIYNLPHIICGVDSRLHVKMHPDSSAFVDGRLEVKETLIIYEQRTLQKKWMTTIPSYS